ncbi:peroxide/acid stress response protein YhcN, partial [Acinetobacter baumannii]
RGKTKTGVKIMKRAMIIASLGLASLLSFGASAAVQQVNAEQAQNLQSMGTISVSQVGSAPMDMRQELAAKAEKEGASSYRIIEARTGDSWHATAELYK